MQHSRRRFVQLLGGSAAGSALGLAGCSNDPEPGRYTDADIALLAAQREQEALSSGKGPYGVQRYAGYRGLAELPWFDLDESGQLTCSDDSVPESIDIHCHLGMSVLFKPTLDLLASTPRVKHLLDCDAENPGCELDLDVYMNANFSEQALDTLQSGMLAQGLWGSEFAETQTVPNLLREMDAMRVARAVILPIKLGLPFGDDQTETWRAAIKQAGAQDRLLTGFSVHHDDNSKLNELRQHAGSGLKLVKLHPTVQRFYPDDQKLMDLYELAQELGVIVFFHGGRAGIEPESSQRYAMPRHYEAALREFPDLQVIFGHAGARDFAGTLELALRYENAWLGTHGQSVSNLETMIKKSGGERLLFGTDWPFYHIGSSLAKVLLTTETTARRAIRQAILRDNAERLLFRGDRSAIGGLGRPG